MRLAPLRSFYGVKIKTLAGLLGRLIFAIPGTLVTCARVACSNSGGVHTVLRNIYRPHLLFDLFNLMIEAGDPSSFLEG